MAQPVWVLSVDLQTKTATFQSGMAEAARSARGSFQDIKDGAKEMSDGVRGASGEMNYSMMEARHSVMILGEEVGVHLPRALTTFVASLGPIGPALEAAFPFLAVILGATLLIEHLAKIGEAEREMEEASRKLTDGMAGNINKVDLEITNIELGIRKLAGASEWDLIAQKLRLEDAQKGMTNVQALESEIQKLLKAAPATSNWNPFNWGDASSEIKAKAGAFEEQMRGKNQSEQVGIAQDTLSLQSKILQEMKGQTDTSAAALHNQQTYVDWLKQETELLQKQADAAVLADQLKQGQDRAGKIKAAEEEQHKVEEIQQRGLADYMKREEEANRKRAEAGKKEVEAAEHVAEDKIRADEAFTKALMEQAKEREKLEAEAGKESARHSLTMGELKIAAERESSQTRMALALSTGREKLNREIELADEEYQLQRQAYAKEIDALDQHDKDVERRKQQLNDKIEELERAHANKVQQIRDQADQQQNSKLNAAQTKTMDEFSRGFTSVLMRQETFSKMMLSFGDQIASGMIQNAIKSMIALDMTKEKEAAAAAREGWLAGMKFPFPTNIAMAPTLAAVGFASMMAFEEGGIVPGVERGDVVPARLEPGEGVINRAVTERLMNADRFGNTGGGGVTNVHHSHNHFHISAIDGASIKGMLDKHGDQFVKHAEGHLRKMNR